MRKQSVYTKELLEPIVRESISLADVIRKLGKNLGGGTHAHLKARIEACGIDTSHFLGSRANSGVRHRGPKRRTWQEVLVTRSSRENAVTLRKALLEMGRPYRCEMKGCTVDGHWLGHTLILHVDHIDSNGYDCRPENLRFLCPNCHSQTDNFGAVRNGKRRTLVDKVLVHSWATLGEIPHPTDSKV